MRRSVIVMSGLLALWGSAAIASDPSFDCAKASSGAEEAICASDDLAALDREVSRLYGLAAKGPNMTDDRLKNLRAYQRGWVKGRDDCWKSDLGIDACVAQEYAIRIQELRQGYADARTEDGPSDGPYPYACDGLDALVGATFINAGKSRVVLQWRENTIVLPISESGSGARYQQANTVFWTKGDDAMFTTPDGNEYSCVRDSMG